jgi:uncharacterized protein (DUF4213/DUF364 family)
MVLITGSTAVNKSMPRLIELSRGAELHLVGPSVPLDFRLFERGVTSLSGSLVPDHAAVAATLKISGHGSFDFSQGLIRRVCYLTDRPAAEGARP